MAEPIVGTPSIVGFGSDYRGNDLGLGLSTLLLSQAMERGHCDLSRDINKGIGDNHVAIITAQNQVAIQMAQNTAETRQFMAQSLLELERIAAQNAAAQAQCCCDIKTLVIEKACATDQLIREIDSNNAKLALQNATAELLAIKYSKGHGAT